MPKGGEFPPQRGGSLLLVRNEVKGDAWMARAHQRQGLNRNGTRRKEAKSEEDVERETHRMRLKTTTRRGIASGAVGMLLNP